MGQRLIRVNELLKREISSILHTRYKSEATGITITDVDTAPNLRQAKVYFSVVDGAAGAQRAGNLLARERREIQQMIAKVIVLKYLPQLKFLEDPSMVRGDHINRLLDNLDVPPPPEDDPDDLSDN
jgi:ribosome-binding factor A